VQVEAGLAGGATGGEEAEQEEGPVARTQLRGMQRIAKAAWAGRLAVEQKGSSVEDSIWLIHYRNPGMGGREYYKGVRIFGYLGV
jgi:hypothetical protein